MTEFIRKIVPNAKDDVLAGITVSLAMIPEVVAFAFGLAAASIFPAIVMGIFSKRMNSVGAITGMIAGLVFTACYIIFFKYNVEIII